MQENSRTYETMESWDRIARGPQTHSIKDAATKTNMESLVPSNSTPTRQHPELGHAHRARMEYDTTQRVTASRRNVIFQAK